MTFFSSPSSPVQAIQAMICPMPSKWPRQSISCTTSPVYYDTRQSHVSVTLAGSKVEEIWTLPIPTLLANGLRPRSKSLYANPLLVEDPIPLGLLMNGDNDYTPKILADTDRHFESPLDYYESLCAVDGLDLKVLHKENTLVIVVAGPREAQMAAKRDLLEKIYFSSQDITVASNIALDDAKREGLVREISSFLDSHCVSYDWTYRTDPLPTATVTVYGFASSLQNSILPEVCKVVLENTGFAVERHRLQNRAAVLTCYPEHMYMDSLFDGQGNVPPLYLLSLLTGTMSNFPGLKNMPVKPEAKDSADLQLLLPPRVRQFKSDGQYQRDKNTLDIIVASKGPNTVLEDLKAISSVDVKQRKYQANQMKLLKFLKENPFLIESLCNLYHVSADIIWNASSGLEDQVCCELILCYRSESMLQKFLREFCIIYSQFQSFSLLFPLKHSLSDIASAMGSALAGISQEINLMASCSICSYDDLIAAGMVDPYAERPIATNLLRVCFTGHLSNIMQFLSCPDVGFMTMGERLVLPVHLSFQWSVSVEAQDFICGKKNGKLIKIMKNTGSYIHFNDNHAPDALFVDIYMSYTIAPLGNMPHMDTFLIPHICRIFGYLREAIEQILGELPATATFYIPEVYHKKIIGHGGKNIQKLMKSLGVYVKFMNAADMVAHEDFSHSDGRAVPLLKGYLTASYTPNVIVKTPSKNWIALEQMKALLLDMCEEVDKSRTCIASLDLEGSSEYFWDLLRIHQSHLSEFTAFRFPCHRFKQSGEDVILLNSLEPHRKETELFLRNLLMMQKLLAYNVQPKQNLNMAALKKLVHPAILIDSPQRDLVVLYLMGSKSCLSKVQATFESELSTVTTWTEAKVQFPQNSHKKYSGDKTPQKDLETSKDNLDEFLRHFPSTLLPSGTRLGSYRQVRKASFGCQFPTVGIIGDKKIPISAPGSPRLSLRTFQMAAGISDIHSAFTEYPMLSFDSDEILKDVQHTNHLNENIIIESIQPWKTPLLPEQILERPHTPEPAK